MLSVAFSGCVEIAVVGCYQPAGPLIPMSSGWDAQKLVQQQACLASPRATVQPVTCQLSVTSAGSVAHQHFSQDMREAQAITQPAAESVPGKHLKMVSPVSMEVGVGTHLVDRKSSRIRSSVCHSDKSRHRVSNVPVGAAHLVVADQERELDLSQKGNGHGTNSSSSDVGGAVVTSHECIVKPALGVVHEVSHAADVTSCPSDRVSQIGHLERFVHGLVTYDSKSQVLNASQSASTTADSDQTSTTGLCDSSNVSSKRKLEPVADERECVSSKKSKCVVADAESSADVFRRASEVSLICSLVEECPKVTDVEGSGLRVDDCRVIDVSVKCVDDADAGVTSLPDVVSTLVPCSKDQTSCRTVDDPKDVESSDLVVSDVSGAKCSSDSVGSSQHLSLSTDAADMTPPGGNPRSKEVFGNNPRKGGGGSAESRQRTSPVRSRSVTELHRKRTQVATTSALDKRLERAVGMAQSVEKWSRRSGDEGSSSRSGGAHRKRDTGGWEWHGEPERKQVSVKVRSD